MNGRAAELGYCTAYTVAANWWNIFYETLTISNNNNRSF